jgi:hypothetical protein
LCFEVFGHFEVGEHAAVGGIGAPLLKSLLLRFFLAGSVGELHLKEHRFAITAAGTKCFDDALELIALLREGQEAVGPGRRPARSLFADGRSQQQRRVRRSRVQLRFVYAHQTLVIHTLARPERAHYRHALEQALVAHGLRRPRVTGHMLIQAFTTADRQPKSTGEHLEQSCRSLCDDHGMITLAWRSHRSHWQRGCLQGRPEPAERVATLTLSLAPRVQVVGAHRCVETSFLGGLYTTP